MPQRPESAGNGLLPPGAEVWAYIRVSSEQQADKGLPVEGQRQAIRKFCETQGLTLAREYLDEAISGSTHNRPDFQRLVTDAQQERPGAIVMWSWSRFSRDQNDAAFYKALLRRQGIQILTIEEGLPHIDGLENVLEAMIHWRDEQYLRQLSANVRRGMRLLAELGYLPAPAGSVPLGYRAAPTEAEINGRLRTVYRMELDPDLAPRVRQAYDMRLAGATYWQIHEAVNLFAAHTSYNNLFRNPAYKGEYMWRDVLIPVPPIVTAQEWQQAYDGLAHGRGGAYSRRKASSFLLSGLAVCGLCGASLSGRSNYHRSNGRRYRYYNCIARLNYHTCDLPLIRAPLLERAVVDFLFSHVLTPRTLAQGREAMLAQLESARSDRQQRRHTLEAEREALAQTIERLVSAIEQAPDASPLLARLKERTAEQRRLELQLSALEEGPEADLREVDLESLREEMRAALEEGPVPAAREVLKRYVVQVIVYEEEATVRYRPPFVLR